jgi:hypothetical protein
MCLNATNVLWSGLNGGSFANMKCDLINTLYQGLPGAKLDFTYKYEKGYRDMVTPYMGYLMSFASTSLVVQSAYESLQSIDVNRWRLVQSRYSGHINYAIQRMRELDNIMQHQMISNVHISVDRILESPQYLKAKNYNESLWVIYNMINNSFTDYHWIMTVKMFNSNLTDTSETFYYNCEGCFTVVDLRKNLEYMIAGVPISSIPNTNYLQKRAYFNEMNRYNSAKDIANKVYNGFCL